VRTFQRSTMFAVALSAVTLAACGRNSAPADRAMSDDLKRDLQLATTSGLDLASQQRSKAFPLTEIPQSSAPSPTRSLKKAAGPKAVRSKQPTVKASPEPTVVASAEDPQAETTQNAPSPTTEPTPDPAAPAVPRPSPTATDPNGGEGAHGRHGGGSNGGISDAGSVLGGIFGVILRGAIGDGDHCDPRRDGRVSGRRPVHNYPQDPGVIIRGTPSRLPY